MKTPTLKTAYVGGPIAGLSGQRKLDVIQFYDDIAYLCAIHNIDAFVPLRKTNVDPHLLRLLKKYNNDRNHPRTATFISKSDKTAIRKSDLVIMFATDISSGAGIEQEYARVCEVPLILMYQGGKAASSMVVGNNNRPIAIINFSTFEDGIKKLDAALTKHRHKF